MKEFAASVLFLSIATFFVFWIGGALKDFQPSEYWIVFLAGAILGALAWLRDVFNDWLKGRIKRRQSNND